MEKKNDRVVYGVMNILFNHFGVPAFMRGDKGTGIRHIILTICTFGIMGIVYLIKGVIEAVRVLKLTDEQYLAEKYGEEAPVEAPAEEAPVEEAPVEEVPVEEVPVEEVPAEAPVEE